MVLSVFKKRISCANQLVRQKRRFSAENEPPSGRCCPFFCLAMSRFQLKANGIRSKTNRIQSESSGIRSAANRFQLDSTCRRSKANGIQSDSIDRGTKETGKGFNSIRRVSNSGSLRPDSICRRVDSICLRVDSISIQVNLVSLCRVPTGIAFKTGTPWRRRVAATSSSQRVRATPRRQEPTNESEGAPVVCATRRRVHFLRRGVAATHGPLQRC